MTAAGNLQKESCFTTEIAGVRFFRTTEATPRTSVVYEPGIVIIGQGSKTGYLDDRVYHYDEDHFLLLTVPMPLECETVASKEEPLLGLFIDIDLTLLHKLVHIVSEQQSVRLPNESAMYSGVGAAVLDDEMKEVTRRLLKCLQSTVDAKVLGPAIISEMLYRVLRGQHGKALHALAQHGGHYSRIAKIVGRIHKDYATPFTTEELAIHAGMSVSVFHRAFKQVTQESPLQYIKKIRLFKAKGLIVHDGISASAAASSVGYESSSQFSREFKRLFNLSPSSLSDNQG